MMTETDLARELTRLRLENEQWERDNDEISRHRLRGMNLDKSGDTDGAISAYARCIEVGEANGDKFFHAYALAYERIIVDLHKVKQYYREASYIRDYLRHDLQDKNREKYQKRLEKLKSKL